MSIKRAVSVEELENTKFIEMPFEGKWKASFGIPERSGVWIIWANSGNGKTSFALQLAKYLTQFGRVAYNTLEEGARKSFQMAVKRANMREVANRFVILNREPLEDLKKRLRKKKSADIVFIDSFQYLELSKAQYKELKEEFHKKLIIFISHADGKEPMGAVAKHVRYDVDVKIRVEGYKAFPTSRYEGNEEYIIWPKGASDYWGEID